MKTLLLFNWIMNGASNGWAVIVNYGLNIFFNGKKNRYIETPKTVEEFKKETELLNQNIKKYPEIDDEYILLLYENI